MKTTTNPHIILALSLISLLGSSALKAREITVKDPTGLSSALDAAQPGDTVKLMPGEWKDVAFTIKRGGADGRPILIQAQEPGKTILTGNTKLEFDAPYVTVDGVFFYKGALADGSVIQFNSNHGTMKNCAIVDYNPPAFETAYYWVYFKGDYNTVDHCYFKGKNNLEPLIGNNEENSRYNSVTGCYFKNIPYNVGNGREDIRVWGPGHREVDDKDGCYFTVQGNLFDHADGEGSEIVSLKSSHNFLVSNTVVATRGCLNIRRGDCNLVKGNIVLGEGREGASGLRMSGAHNTVQGNYVSGCDYGINVSTGEYIDSPLTGSYKPDVKKNKGGGDLRIPMYAQIQDLTLNDNVTVDNAGPDLDVGAGYKKHWPEVQIVMLPEACQIKNNRFIRPKGGDSVVGTVQDAAPPLDRFQFKPNTYEGNILLGGKNTFPPAAQGCKEEPLPSGWTVEQEMANFKPLTANDVGPDWVITMRKAGNFPMEDPASSDRPINEEKKKKKKDKG